ncbi:unnamed protein product [Lupinus luteus]|uniref:Fibronectin type-III domain-containing protein n=1 Tax=Lupinus luteus TaxID=3873 RepID=A0AAV1XQT1_LUPLU
MNENKSKKQDSKKVSGLGNQPCRKLHRKGENPMRFVPDPIVPSGFGHSHSWICKNSACRAVLSKDDTFCKRCSCCICHLFDDNKDPSLWLVCTSESAQWDSCGSSCHIECSLQHEKMGVVDHGQLMQLDGGYCCASCGKVTAIIGIYLSYSLLDGTSRFKELHEMVKEVKAKLETEVGPVNGVYAKMARGIVSRLPIANDVQKLCSLAIEKADESLSNVNPESRAEGSLPAACKFVFEDVTASSVKIILIEMSNVSSKDSTGYKLWYYKSRDESHAEDPACVFPKIQRKILISDLQPCTEYTFQIISFMDIGDLGHYEAKCFTKSIEIMEKYSSSLVAMNHEKENLQNGDNSSGSKMDDSGFKVLHLGKNLRFSWAHEQGCLEGYFCHEKKNCCGQSETIKPSNLEEKLPSLSQGLDLNVVSMPDLNEELTPPFESSRDEDNGCTLQHAVEAENAASHDLDKNCLARSHGSDDSQTWTNGQIEEVPAVDSRNDACRKRVASTNEETHDCDSILINGSPFRKPDDSLSLYEYFEY